MYEQMEVKVKKIGRGMGMGNNKGQWLNKKWFAVLLSFFAALLFFYPVARTLVSSVLAPDTDGSGFTVRYYVSLLLDELWFYPMFWNSIFYGLGTALPALLFVIPAGFALAKGKWRSKGILVA